MTYDEIEQSAFGGNLSEYYKFVVGSNVYRYTTGAAAETLATGDSDIDGDYAPAVIEIAEPEHSRDIPTTSVVITVSRSNEVAELFIGYVPDTKIAVFVYRKHQDSDDAIQFWSGRVIAANFVDEGSRAELLCEPVLASAKRRALRFRWQTQCNLVLYTARCGVDRTDFEESQDVVSINGNDVTFTDLSAFSPDYFVGGYAQSPDGSHRFITAQSGDTLTFLLNFDDLDPGDTVLLYPGCDRLHTTCRAKFFPAGDPTNPDGNIVNFFGFFRTPGRNIFKIGLLGGSTSVTPAA